MPQACSVCPVSCHLGSSHVDSQHVTYIWGRLPLTSLVLLLVIFSRVGTVNLHGIEVEGLSLDMCWVWTVGNVSQNRLACQDTYVSIYLFIYHQWNIATGSATWHMLLDNHGLPTAYELYLGTTTQQYHYSSFRDKESHRTERPTRVGVHHLVLESKPLKVTSVHKLHCVLTGLNI